MSDLDREAVGEGELRVARWHAEAGRLRAAQARANRALDAFRAAGSADGVERALRMVFDLGRQISKGRR